MTIAVDGKPVMTRSILASPCKIIGLVDGTSYTATASAVNKTGVGLPSDPVSFVTSSLPGPPTAVLATAGYQSASVSFSPPADTGGTPVTSYKVIAVPSGVTVTATSSPVTVTGLPPGSISTFNVYAINAMGRGKASMASNRVLPYAEPGVPTINSVTAGPGSASISFSPPISNGGSQITSYTVTSDPDGITALGTTSPVTVAGLTAGTPYVFSITATNIGGTGLTSSPSKAVSPL